MVSIIHYEVYLYHGGKWQLHGRYASNQRKQAVDDAKYTEAALSCPSKVIREIYDTSTSEVEEVVIYISEKIRTGQYAQTSKRGLRSGGSLWDALREGDPVSSTDNKKIPPTIDAGIKLLSVVSISVLLALFLATVITFLTSYLSQRGSIAPTNPARIFMAIFIAVFIFTSVPLASAFVPWNAFDQIGQNKKSNDDKNTKKDSFPALNEKNTNKELNPLTALFSWLFGLNDKEEKKEEEELPKPYTNQQQKPKSEKEDENKENLEKIKMPSIESLREANPIEKEPETPKKEEKQPEKKQPDQKKLPPEPKPAKPEPPKKDEKKQKPNPEPQEEEPKKEEIIDEELEINRTIIMKFLGGAVAAYKTKYSQIDAYNKFGMNLVLSGAIESLKEKNNLSDKNYNILLCETIEFMGTNSSLAQAFCNKLEEYSIEPTYLNMIRAGNEAMGKMLQKLADPFKTIIDVFNVWNNPDQNNKDRQNIGIMTIMFTDMVNSTISTQNLGDEAAQELIRTHNRIVRSILGDFEGKEVKHTGDGIMASFTSSSNALEAAVKIQRSFEMHNQENPDSIIKIRIGINAGEPIVEDDDLFGTTVQIAARVCDYAQPEQILVTNVVKELSAGKVKQFYDLGATNLKGIKDPILLYKIDWQDDELLNEENNISDNDDNDNNDENTEIKNELQKEPSALDLEENSDENEPDLNTVETKEADEL